jgi:putative membrane protein
MNRLSLAIAAISLFASSAAFGQGKISDTDERAMKNLAEANLAEIEAGKLAADKAQSPQIKQFAQRMVDDHARMLDELKKLADAKGVDLPGSAGMGQRAHTARLRMKSGADFDKDYMSDMVQVHEKDAKETHELARSVSDPQLKSAMQKAHAKMHEHLSAAKQLAGSTSSASGSTSSSTSK